MNQQHIISSLYKASYHQSKLPPEVLAIPGFCPPNIRHFLNNLCSLPNTTYLEIGSFKGASCISASYDNTATCYAIDNFSEFEGTRKALEDNLTKFKDHTNISFIEGDCWEVDVSHIKDVNVFFYDGNHSRESQKKALIHFYKCLSELGSYFYLCDDFSWTDSFSGTQDALEELKPKIDIRVEIHDEENKGGWWNGLGIFLCRK